MRFHWISRKTNSVCSKNYSRLHFEQLEDRRMLTTFTVNSLDDSSILPGVVTLRSAIEAANDNANPTIVDNIRFDNSIFNGTIQLDSALPTITEPVNIQVDPFFPISSDRITIDGTNLLSGSGLDINLTGTSVGFAFMQIQGLIIQDFPDHGINVQDLPDTITFEDDINEIDNNGGNGININLPSNQNIEEWKISNNIITNNTVGIRASNISFTKFNISGNKIGTDGTSITDGNLSHGIYLSDVSASSADSLSGISSNTISGNGGHGIFLQDTSFIAGDILFNEIGVDETVDSVIPNGGDGIHLLRSRTEIASNDIGGNNGDGIEINDSDLVDVLSNRIGTKLGNLELDLGNQGTGVFLSNGSKQAKIDTNFIYYNGSDGVAVSQSTSDRNEITKNDFRGNTGIPIDLLGLNGLDVNDSDDADPGPNDLMNYPVINATAITQNGSTWTIPFSFDVDVSGDYRFEFYVYDLALDRYQFVQSKDVMGVTVGASDFVGNVTLLDGAEVSEGDRLSVLAVRTSGSTNVSNTSELSSPTAPLISPPTIADVRLDRRGGNPDDWVPAAEVSFATRVAAGQQFKPIATQGANTIDIVFSEDVIFGNNGSELELKGKRDVIVAFDAFNYNQSTFTATWTFNTPLPTDKYAIYLNDTITDAAGNRLDGEWVNPTNNTPDDYADDVNDPLFKSTFLSGNGSAGSTDSNNDGQGEFRFHFAYLPGDYDGNGVVEATEAVTGDGDGDGDAIGDAGDVAVRDSNVGNMLPLRAVGGADLNDDEKVDGFDLTIIEQGFGGSGVPGDVDGDGDVDGADILLWQREANGFSAWYEGNPFAGVVGTTALFTVGAAPQVTNVTISGSLSLHAPYAFDTVVGSGEQLRTVPVGGADTVSITFSELVNITADSLDIIGLQTANIPQLAEFTYDALTMTATWRFEAWALGDQYLISVPDSVTDVEGNLLDGEWTNPASLFTVNSAVSEFPSGDGTAGGHFNFVATLLAGDANLDGIVDGNDFNILLSNWNSTAIDKLFIDADFNGDGAVSSDDYNQLINNWQLNLQTIWILADINGDGVVDALDQGIIDSNYGLTGATYADGDLNGDGLVDINDLDLVFAQFGLGLALAS